MAGKKKLKPGIAFVLMLVMICCALIHGSYKHWNERLEMAKVYTDRVEQQVELNRRTAHNLRTVALRHMEASDSLMVELHYLVNRIGLAENTMDYNVRMCDLFAVNAQSVLEELVKLPSVIADSRDYMYVSQMLPQAVEECIVRDAYDYYDQFAIAFNNELNSTFTGMLARMAGIKTMPYAGYASNELVEMVR